MQVVYLGNDPGNHHSSAKEQGREEREANMEYIMGLVLLGQLGLNPTGDIWDTGESIPLKTVPTEGRRSGGNSSPTLVCPWLRVAPGTRAPLAYPACLTQ